MKSERAMWTVSTPLQHACESPEPDARLCQQWNDLVENKISLWTGLPLFSKHLNLSIMQALWRVMMTTIWITCTPKGDDDDGDDDDWNNTYTSIALQIVQTHRNSTWEQIIATEVTWHKTDFIVFKQGQMWTWTWWFGEVGKQHCVPKL